MEDAANPGNHRLGIGSLPNVTAHIDADGAALDRVEAKLEYVLVRVKFGAARDDDGNGALCDHFLETLTVVGFHDIRPDSAQMREACAR